MPALTPILVRWLQCHCISHPARSLLIKEQINKIANGSIDQTMFTKNLVEALGNTSVGYGKSIKKMGVLQSFEYLGEEKGINNGVKVFYKATYESSNVFFQITLTPDNKIDFISIEKL